ncbi:MBL fold metallo-hydrolase [Parabacteroides sp. PF5-6]|uniref:MBL fold metallo-hydrolase n=1 Tax=Parabacteroides sp. PF5-6 TaxID=1742403 RepID=UPI002405021E|nr:MBL fold metallo-hydrolase [Parabacteroides sp. PF5-6]MDF9829276.1 glyoxylase-like metal-dependent hydrolase (beta-lactamase superfamily II) [Parabacteroides sp. PF5-6]
MKIEVIDTGFFYADGGAMFGAIPKTAWRRRYPSDEANGCVLAMRTLLVTTDDGRTILIDTGAGDKHLRYLSYYRFFNLIDLTEALAQRQILPGQVTDVILTHLHFDHCGYCTRYNADGKPVVTFPNARHWVSQAQWSNFLTPNALEKDSYFPENILPVEEAGLLQLVTEKTALCPAIDLHLFDGHTPGQLVPYIHTPERTFVFAGDVIPLAASLSPEWISAYDTYPVTSYNEKLRLLEQAAREHQAILFCHDAYTTCTTVKKTGKSYKSLENIQA